MQSMLNSNGENGHPCLVPDFRGNAFNFSPLRIMFAVGFSYIAFIMLRSVQFSSVAQSCPTLCDPIDSSPPGSAVHGILQARTLEWVAISFSNA